MNVMLCVDDNYGMLFNHRRQSSDCVLLERIAGLVGENRLWMNAYSEKLFSELGLPHILIDENYMEKAEKGDFCFVEDLDIANYYEEIERLVLFKWNRRYPADMCFTFDPSLWVLEDAEDFAGHSHEKITKEIYRRWEK